MGCDVRTTEEDAGPKWVMPARNGAAIYDFTGKMLEIALSNGEKTIRFCVIGTYLYVPTVHGITDVLQLQSEATIKCPQASR